MFKRETFNLFYISDKLNSAGRHHLNQGSKSHQHHHNQHTKSQQQQHQGMALSNVLQAASGASLTLPTGSTAQLCSNQAIFKSGQTFNFAKNNQGKLTVQPVSLTFPISVNQQGLAALTSSKPQ